MAGHSDEDTEFAKNDDVGVRHLTVVDHLSIAAVFGCVTLDVKDDVGFVFGASGILQSDEEFRGIEVNAELMRPSGAPNSQVAHERFFAGERFLACDLIPLFALVLDGVGDALPNNAAQADRSFVVQLGLMRFEFLRQFLCEKFLSRVFCPIGRHGPPPAQQIVYTRHT